MLLLLFSGSISYLAFFSQISIIILVNILLGVWNADERFFARWIAAGESQEVQVNYSNLRKKTFPSPNSVVLQNKDGNHRLHGARQRSDSPDLSRAAARREARCHNGRRNAQARHLRHRLLLSSRSQREGQNSRSGKFCSNASIDSIDRASRPILKISRDHFFFTISHSVYTLIAI